MVDQVKKVLALLALCCMALFIGAVLYLSFTGTLAQNQGWVYGPLTGFLMLGVTTIAIKKLQERAARQREAEAECAKAELPEEQGASSENTDNGQGA